MFKKYMEQTPFIHILSRHVEIFKYSILCYFTVFTQLLCILFIIIFSFENICEKAKKELLNTPTVHTTFYTTYKT